MYTLKGALSERSKRAMMVITLGEEDVGSGLLVSVLGRFLIQERWVVGGAGRADPSSLGGEQGVVVGGSPGRNLGRGRVGGGPRWATQNTKLLFGTSGID